jgi:hypothetical protein
VTKAEAQRHIRPFYKVVNLLKVLTNTHGNLKVNLKERIPADRSGSVGEAP